MKAASGDTPVGGDIKLCAMVEGLSLDMLCVLDREGTLCGGEAMADEGRDQAESKGEAMCEVTGMRTPLDDLAAGRQANCAAEVCGRGETAPRIRLILRSDLHTALSNAGGRPADYEMDRGVLDGADWTMVFGGRELGNGIRSRRAGEGKLGSC